MLNKLAAADEWGSKTVWVTGANQGIGAAAAALFNALGCQVVAIDKRFEEVSTDYKQVELDISDAQRVAQTCQSLLGQGHSVDILVNVAGILHMGTTEEISVAAWQESLNVNASGHFYLMQALIPELKEKQAGAIISVSSNANHVPRIAMPAYSASKAALTSLTMVAGLELAEHNIRCNVVSPGSTQTPMQWSLWRDEQGEEHTIAGSAKDHRLGIPLKKLATPEDIAHSIAFLASSLANHITLQDIVVDGGATLGA